jgi:hypothetical protein
VFRLTHNIDIQTLYSINIEFQVRKITPEIFIPGNSTRAVDKGCYSVCESGIATSVHAGLSKIFNKGVGILFGKWDGKPDEFPAAFLAFFTMITKC